MSKDNATAAMLMAIIAVRQNVDEQSQVPNANTNGGDASRVGAFFSSLISRYREKVSPIIKYRLYLSF